MARKRWILGAALLAGLAPVPPTTTSAAEQESPKLASNFEDQEVGKAPSGLRTGLTGRGRPPVWTVLEDPTAPAGSKVAAETSGDATSDRFPVLIQDAYEARDVRVTVAFKPISGKVDQAAGLVVRFKDPDNYYIARANALEDNVRLYKVAGGKRTQIAGKDIEIPAGKWQTLGLSVRGDRLEVWLDGRRLLEARDATFAEAGKIGLWTKAESYAGN